MPRSQCRHGENGLLAATPLDPSLGRLGRLATVFAWFRQEPTASPLSPFMSSPAALMPGGPRTLSTCCHLTRKRFRASRCSCRLLGRTCSSHLNFRRFSRTLETLRITPRIRLGTGEAVLLESRCDLPPHPGRLSNFCRLPAAGDQGGFPADSITFRCLTATSVVCTLGRLTKCQYSAIDGCQDPRPLRSSLE